MKFEQDPRFTFDTLVVGPGNRMAAAAGGCMLIRASALARAGGIAVIAHPGRYGFDDLAMSAMLDAFKDLGGAGIEVTTGSHSPDQFDEYARVARRYGFLASRGTDFHAPGESRVEFDALPPLPVMPYSW